ncbi:hypothetical protein PWT90_07373 [Aphanocladium album]|nr:hypothetical protein PWT90_07373 [Aphanocladium album]
MAQQGTLARLPAEIILNIGQNISKTEDLKAFATKALFHFAAKGDSNGIEAAISAGAKVNEVYEPSDREKIDLVKIPGAEIVREYKALVIAVIHGRVAAVERLLDHGGAVDTEIGDKLTLFWLAASLGSIKMMQLLRRKGSNVDCENSSGQTPLHFFSRLGNKDVVECLLELGASVHGQGSHEQRNTPFGVAVSAGEIDVCRVLFKHDSCIDYQNREAQTPLHMAVAAGHRLLALYLIERGADVHLIDSFNNTALLLAAKHGNTSMVRLLHMVGGSDINHADSTGNTALHIAALLSNVKLTQYLLISNADVHRTNINGDIALGIASKAAGQAVAEPLWASPDDDTVEQKASATKQIVELLEESGTMLNSTDQMVHI